jgi:hypothetical protein
VFNTVADAEVNIRMISQGASEINISFVVQESDVPRVVRHLHDYFFPAKARAAANSAKTKTKKAGLASSGANGAGLRSRRINGRSAASARKAAAAAV